MQILPKKDLRWVIASLVGHARDKSSRGFAKSGISNTRVLLRARIFQIERSEMIVFIKMLWKGESCFEDEVYGSAYNLLVPKRLCQCDILRHMCVEMK